MGCSQVMRLKVVKDVPLHFLRQLALCSCIGAVLYLFTNFRSQIHSESVARRGSSKDLFAKYISCASVFVHVSVSVF